MIKKILVSFPSYQGGGVVTTQGPRNSGAEWALAPTLFCIFCNEKSERMLK